ncbi:hypothetical protein ACFYW6_23310 [Streptomyces sp. NPDC002659]|uniref:hypothetical protein n=1 Tax=Streptomyces sp. NPDC002659 TaxID=3364656 RepID=UPI0036A6D3D3
MKDDRASAHAAVYLRCYPYDKGQMSCHRLGLFSYARELGLSAPTVFLDNGRRFTGPLPELERLLDEVDGGAYDVVLVPGLFVFSLDDSEARLVSLQIRDAGCQVVELPSPRAAVALLAEA